MYGFIDLSNPSRLYTLKGASTLPQVWRELRGMAHVGIIRLSDNRLIWRRVMNHQPIVTRKEIN